MHNPNGAFINKLQGRRLSAGVKKPFIQWTYFSLFSILFITFSAMPSSDILSFNKHSRTWLQNVALICICPYFMLSYFIFFLSCLEAKSIDLVLFSPKYILSLLSTNQSHILQKSSFNLHLILKYLYYKKSLYVFLFLLFHGLFKFNTPWNIVEPFCLN